MKTVENRQENRFHRKSIDFAENLHAIHPLFFRDIFFGWSESENRMKTKTTTYLSLVPRGSLIFTILD